MLFNSLHFALFLPIVFFLYWLISGKNVKTQNVLLLIASYFFYACWDWRFLFLLFFSTLLDYITGLKLAGEKNQRRRKMWLWFTISINLGFLGIFKYFNFFTSSLTDTLSFIGIQVNTWSLNIILPLGISFYTFHGLSYIIDVYKNKIKPEKNFIDYSVFVGFFPLLVAGPIERATHLLPQIKKERTFDYSKSVDGLKQILWGLFKKLVIADNCAEYVIYVFNHHESHAGSTLALGGLFFVFQLYADFSGYSDIALGVSRLFGIELTKNFNHPFRSKSITEFWRRWHISLSSWFNDYLFTPMATHWRNWGTTGICMALMITFILCGTWHGANWTFVVYGMMHGLALVVEFLTKKFRMKLFSYLPDFVGMIIGTTATFIYVYLSWIFFRSDTVGQAIRFIAEIFQPSLFTVPEFPYPGIGIITLWLIAFFLLVEWFGRKQEHAIAVFLAKQSRFTRWTFYSFLIFLIGMYMNTTETPFIYFQF